MSIFQLFYKGEQNEHIFKQKPPNSSLFMHYHHLFFLLLSLFRRLYPCSLDPSNHPVFRQPQSRTGRILRFLLFGTAHSLFPHPQYSPTNLPCPGDNHFLFADQRRASTWDHC